MRRIFTFSLGLVFALSTTTLKAQLLINENFTGYSAGNLTGQGSWQTTNNSGSQIQVVALPNNTGALSKAGYSAGTNYVTIDNSNSRDYYKNVLGAAPSISTAATFYYSFLVRVPSSAGTTTTGSASGVLGFRTGNGDLTAMFLIGDANSNTNLKFGISTDNSNNTWASANYSFNTTYLVVIRYDAVPGSSNDKMTIWVDPPSLASEAAMGTAAATITNGLGYSSTTISAIEFVQTFSGADAQFDGLKAAYGNGNATQAQDALEAWSNFSPAGAPLPVKFQNLNARSINNSVSLNWNVASEEDLSGYSVERSNDGRGFSQIAFVNASGQSEYSFVDNKPSSVSYYRIKSVDVNGRFGYSTVALVKSGSSSIVIKAFPSPVIKNLSIQHPTAVAGNSIIISSADGRVIKTIVPTTGAQQTDVDLSSAKAGLYVVRFNGANGESETLKILKQ